MKDFLTQKNVDKTHPIQNNIPELIKYTQNLINLFDHPNKKIKFNNQLKLIKHQYYNSVNSKKLTTKQLNFKLNKIIYNILSYKQFQIKI